MDPNLRQFFGNRLPMAPEAPESGLGSGVIISADGYIVTNNHVVDGAKQVTVTLSDGRELTARVVGRDPQTDVAVIKVSAKDLPAITFASSHKVEVGDRVLAIGNPFGIGETVTTGIVSATSRRAGLGLAYEDFIQTDAAINPGNSGGALVDVEGRLVGINTAILSHSGGFQGVGLAVPADLVGSVVDNLVAHGKVVRSYIGVGIQDPDPRPRGFLRDQGYERGGPLFPTSRPGRPGRQGRAEERRRHHRGRRAADRLRQPPGNHGRRGLPRLQADLGHPSRRHHGARLRDDGGPHGGRQAGRRGVRRVDDRRPGGPQRRRRLRH